MLIFLGAFFLIFTLFVLPDMKVNSAAPKLLTALYVGGMVLLDIAVLVLMATVWAVENGKL